MAAKFDVEETLAKLTMNQKIKLLCGKVCLVVGILVGYMRVLTAVLCSYPRDGGIRSPFPRLVLTPCA